MDLIVFYGMPPAHAECHEVDFPADLSVTTDQRLLHSVVGTGMVPHGLNRPASSVAIVRQLQVHFADVLPVRVTVPKYGTFRIGEKGWCVE